MVCSLILSEYTDCHDGTGSIGDQSYRKVRKKGGKHYLFQHSKRQDSHSLSFFLDHSSGKTLAFTLPLLPHILDQPHIVPNQDGPIALILTPTRELAKQVHSVTKKFISLVGGKAMAITGGMGTYEMTKELKKGCEVVVSTPGRFIDMVTKKATNCRRVTMVVLDEADKMLDMGFEAQVKSILDHVRPDRQTLMFSATFGKRVERVAKGWLKNPVR